MQLLTEKSNTSMLSMDVASTTSTVSMKCNIKRNNHHSRGAVQKAHSMDDDCYSESPSSDCYSDSADKLFTTKSNLNSCANTKLIKAVDNHVNVICDTEYDDDSDSDSDSIMDNFDVTLVDNDDLFSPKNDAERMFFEVVEVLRFEQKVRNIGIKLNIITKLYTPNKKCRHLEQTTRELLKKFFLNHKKSNQK